MSKRVEKLDSIIDPKVPSSLIQARDELGSIISDLEKMKVQLESTDSPSRQPNTKQKQSMETAIVELLKHTKILKGHIDNTIRSGEARDGVSDTGSEGSVSDSPMNVQDPLKRDEIGKLLLLVSKAYQTRQITKQQRGVIKNRICRRSGYLRMILEQDDMNVVIAALAAVGEESS